MRRNPNKSFQISIKNIQSILSLNFSFKDINKILLGRVCHQLMPDFPKTIKIVFLPHHCEGSIKEKSLKQSVRNIFQEVLPEILFHSKLFHYFPCTINLLMDRIASCKNTHKINFQFPGFLNPTKSFTGQILAHSLPTIT